MKGKGKGKAKQGNNIDDMMKNIDLGAYGDENMDDGMDAFEKKFNPEQQFNMPIYDNIDNEFEKFGKMFGADEEPNLSSTKNNAKESEEDKILRAILGDNPNIGAKKKKNNDMEELTKALKMAEANQNKRQSKDNDAELLKGIFAGTGNSNKKKKDDGMDELNNILNAADQNLKNKNKSDMDLVKQFLTKEELGEAQGEKGPKKNTNIKQPEKVENKNIDEDLYPLKQEQIFHRIKEMKSLTVLEKEIKLCNFIIEYKKKKKIDYKEWENKITEATNKLNEIKNKVENGEMDYEEYKKTISDELAYEQKLVNIYLEKDKASSPAQIEQIKKRINDRMIIINKEINNEVEDEEEEQEQEEKVEKSKISNSESTNQEAVTPVQSNEEKTKLYVDLLLQQYLSAKDYFKENDLKEQQKDCIEKCKQIIIAKKKIQNGNIKEINLNELPKSIKPEYIYGCSSDERTSKFKEILSELIKQKDEIDQIKKAYTEKLKKLNKKEFANVKDTAKGVLDSYQSKIKKYNETIESIKEKFKDKWVPAPEFCRVEEEDKVEKINNDIPEYTMRIHIGKTDYEKDSVYLKVHLKYGEKELTKEVNMKGNKDFNETWDWKFEKNDYKYLFKKCLEIELERSYWYKFGGSNVKGSAKIDLKSLKDNIQLVGDYKLELVSKRTTPSINVSINLRTPFAEKQYETVTKEVFSVKKIYPPFNPKAATVPGSSPSKNPVTSNNKADTAPKTNISNEQTQQKPKIIEKKEEIKQKNNEIINNNKIEDNKKPKEESNNTQNAQNAATTTNETEQKVDKSMFKDEELADVDGVDYINSLKVLEYKLKLLEAQIAKISGRTPRELMQKKVKMSCKIKMFQQQMGDGEVTPQDYYNLLNQQLTHDKALFTYFKQEKDLEKAKLVAIRIKLMNEEIEELKQYIK
jgi:hypothetical protein